ncbi:hypothetical protein ACHAXT_003668 [Thalassiosira profunda]
MRRKAPDTNKAKQRRKAPTKSISTFNTAVAIVPPDDAWDAIQRARHLARDTTFYRWPPAIRLFHPFAPPARVPDLVGKLAEYVEEEMGKHELLEILDEGLDRMAGDAEYYDALDGMLGQLLDSGAVSSGVVEGAIDALDERLDEEERVNGDNLKRLPPSAYLSSFEVTLDSIQILPHWEVLDARIEALEERMPQRTLGLTIEEQERQKRIEKGRALIEEEERRGLKRKKERERKKRLKRKMKKLEEAGGDMASDDGNAVAESDDEDDEDDEDDDEATPNKNGFNGPCVIYLSPDDESRSKLEALRQRLRGELFDEYDAFSPGSSVSPYPEHLPRKKAKAGEPTAFRPLLPIARFPTVESAVKVAKVLQRTWDPLTFNVTDIQFVSRNDPGHHTGDATKAGGMKKGEGEPHLDEDIPEVRHRRQHGTLHTATSSAKDRMALTSSGEVDDVGRRGAYGCDALVMLWGEELDEEDMEEEASLSMIMDDEEEDDLDDVEDEDDGGKIDYTKVFATAEREYQRMRAHEELLSPSSGGDMSIFDETVTETTDIEAWLDGDDDEDGEDEGATVVVGRAQFFVGAMREFVGMPASSAIDSKDRIMGSGVSATARRKGSVSRLAESWEKGDYGQKESDRRPYQGRGNADNQS